MREVHYQIIHAKYMPSDANKLYTYMIVNWFNSPIDSGISPSNLFSDRNLSNRLDGLNLQRGLKLTIS